MNSWIISITVFRGQTQTTVDIDRLRRRLMMRTCPLHLHLTPRKVRRSSKAAFSNKSLLQERQRHLTSWEQIERIFDNVQSRHESVFPENRGIYCTFTILYPRKTNVPRLQNENQQQHINIHTIRYQRIKPSRVKNKGELSKQSPFDKQHSA